MNNLAKDVYFDSDYVNLYLQNDESLFRFTYEENNKYFSHIAIKRPIREVAGCSVEQGFFDLETAYGYGGFLTNTDDELFLKKALESYKLYCHDNNVIAEFIRHHPFSSIPNAIKTSFDFFVKDRRTVFIDLSLNKEERWATYGKKTRNILRRASEQLTFKESSDINCFLNLYYRTMEKNTADDFYFFEEDYFRQLISLENVKLYKVSYGETTLSAGFFMLGNKLAHYHLSGNNMDYSRLHGNYFLIDSVCDVMRNDFNLKCFHLGGGRTSSDDDSLLRFKKKFSPLAKDFYIAGKVYHGAKYSEYCSLWERLNAIDDINFFLKYRL